VKALGRLPLSNIADLHSKPQALGDCAGGGSTVDADAVGVHQGIHFAGVKDLPQTIGFTTLTLAARFE
jgi:hypothetical protein